MVIAFILELAEVGSVPAGSAGHREATQDYCPFWAGREASAGFRCRVRWESGFRIAARPTGIRYRPLGGLLRNGWPTITTLFSSHGEDREASVPHLLLRTLRQASGG